LTRRIGILGGSFNPIHIGHLTIAREAAKRFDLRQVVFVPTGMPPHKNPKTLAPREDRYQMLKIATRHRRGFEISRVELDRDGYSYAYDTFQQLQKEFGGDTDLFYIMGLDSINEILSWKKPMELFKMCEFIVATRPGSRLRTFRRLFKFPPLQHYFDKIHLMELEMKISATELRRRIREGRTVGRRIPKAVLEYIKEHDLYRD